MKISKNTKILILTTFVFALIVIAFNIYTTRLTPIPEIIVTHNESEVELSKNIENYLESERVYLDINTATASELMLIPGIGEVLANNIVNYRAHIGEFSNLEQLLDVDRIGEATLSNIKPYIYIE